MLVVAIFYFLRKKIDPAQMWAAITAMTWLELAILGLLALWNLCTYAFVWMSVTPGLGFWRAMVMTQSTTAVGERIDRHADDHQSYPAPWVRPPPR